MKRLELLRELGAEPVADRRSGAARPTVSLEELKRTYVREVMRQTGGHRGHTARILGIAPRTLYNYLQRG
jgi:DNA-binding NtrC family response regulator